jgi:hypothetical protein
MGHFVACQDFHHLRGLLTEQEAHDLVDVMYRHRDNRFQIIAAQKPSDLGVKVVKVRGQHRFNFLRNRHEINLFRGNLVEAFEEKARCGGNGPAPSLRMAAAMVLSHELQHANQFIEHGSKDRTFYGTKHGRGFLEGRDVQIKYDKRPAEQDARRYVDENLDVIASVLGVEAPPRLLQVSGPDDHGDHGGELDEITALFEELSEVSVKDIAEELRASGINNPVNVGRVKERLKLLGVQIR